MCGLQSGRKLKPGRSSPRDISSPRRRRTRVGRHGEEVQEGEKGEKSKKCVFAPAPFGPCRPRTPPARHRRTRRAPTPESRTPSLTVTPSPPPAGRTRRSVPVAMTRVPQVRPLQNQIPRTARCSPPPRREDGAPLASSRLATAPSSTIVSNLDARDLTPPSPHLPSRTQAKKLAARLKQGEVAGYTDAENPSATPTSPSASCGTRRSRSPS